MALGNSLFIEAPSLQSYVLNKDILNPNAITFVDNDTLPCIIAQNKLYRVVPVGTTSNTVLAWDSGTLKWISIADGTYIKGYLNSIDDAPSNAVNGSIYMVRPSEGVIPSSGQYQMYIKTEQGWVNNGPFNGLPVGVVQSKGTSTTEVMSQKATTDALGKLTPIKVSSEEEYEDMLLQGMIQEDQLYYIAEE